MSERLQKVMAHAGIASRRKSEKIIEAGRVKVNGVTIRELGFKVSQDDIIEVDGNIIERETFVYILMHKSKDTITSTDDPFGRQTVLDLLADQITERVYPVGRLDYDTTGALLLTNDGKLTHQLIHPKFELQKTYQVHVIGKMTKERLKQLEEGVVIDGKLTAPAIAKLKRAGKSTSEIELRIHEGRYHQVKKMLDAVGHPVIRLHRSHFGPLDISDLSEGQWRHLEPNEISQLKSL